MQIQNLQHGNKPGDQDKSRQRNDIQRDIVMAESDLRKAATEKSSLEMEVRQLKKDEAHIKVNLPEKQARLGKMDYEMLQIENQIKSLKKKLNMLG